MNSSSCETKYLLACVANQLIHDKDIESSQDYHQNQYIMESAALHRSWRLGALLIDVTSGSVCSTNHHLDFQLSCVCCVPHVIAYGVQPGTTPFFATHALVGVVCDELKARFALQAGVTSDSTPTFALPCSSGPPQPQ